MAERFNTSLRAFAGAIWGSFGLIARNNLGLIAAGVAFFAMLSIFPALAALIALLSLVANPSVVIAQLEETRGLMPDDVYQILNSQIVGLVTTSSDQLGWAGSLSLGVAVWSARAGVGAMMNGLDAAYGHPNRSSVSHYFRAILLTIALVAVGVVALLTVVVAPVALALIPLGWLASLVAESLRWSIAIVVIFAGLGLLYRYGPNHQGLKLPWVTPGAVFGVMSWAALSYAFSYYVTNFANYKQFYGSIGAVIAMLIWLWISSFLVLLGAVLNAELEKHRSRVRYASDDTPPPKLDPEDAGVQSAETPD